MGVRVEGVRSRTAPTYGNVLAICCRVRIHICWYTVYVRKEPTPPPPR